jgi:putative FmdB family regulatory protein
MPLYEYQCTKCGVRFEKIQKFSDPLVDTCPTCGGKVEKLLSAPAFTFKGTGFYITDYSRKGETAAGEKAERAGKSGKSEESGASEGPGKSEGSGKSGGSEKTESAKSDSGSKESSSDKSAGAGEEKTKAPSPAPSKPTKSE